MGMEHKDTNCITKFILKFILIQMQKTKTKNPNTQCG